MGSREVEEWLWIRAQGGSFAEDLAGVPIQKVAGSRFWEPRADVWEEGHRFLLKFELPGVRPEDVTLSYLPDRHAIAVSGIRLDDFEGVESVGLHQLEVPYGEFRREVALPAVTIDKAAIRAQYRNGFLVVMVPKLERVIVTRHVPISQP
ncbi:MAG: Hsp20/alpha crystallin family protein [Fimbriimonadaceae bacterium]|nr:Hsp20/alpha crystallin family protein [Fimbriimonadaceae bacterium]